jgi:hypothetical protein
LILALVIGSPLVGAPAAATAQSTAPPTPVVVAGQTYDAYNPAAEKLGQFYWYTCEFDAAWVVLKTFGYEVPFEDQLAIVGWDTTVQPYVQQDGATYTIYGGDIEQHFSGDYTSSFLARTTANAMRPLFERFGLSAEPVNSREEIEQSLLDGSLIWMKATVDFKPWQEATWVTPDGDSFKTVLGNDHAVVAIGFNAQGVVVRDPLGPTDTNWNRAYEYLVPWDTFLAVAEAQDFNMLAVSLKTGEDGQNIAALSAGAPVSGLPADDGDE